MIEKGRILPGRLLLKEIPEEEKAAGSLIYRPVVVKQRTHVGKVVLVGKQLPSLDHEIQVGNIILHAPNCFTNVDIDGEQYRLLNAQDALFIYK